MSLRIPLIVLSVVVAAGLVVGGWLLATADPGSGPAIRRGLGAKANRSDRARTSAQPVGQKDLEVDPIETSPASAERRAREPGPPTEARRMLENLRENPRSARLQGRVVDAESHGVAGATVSVRVDSGGASRFAWGGAEIAGLTTDEEGAFALDPGPLIAGRRYLLEVRHPEFAQARFHPVDPLRPSTLKPRILLERGERLAGRVLRKDGTADSGLAGAEILVWAADRMGPGGEDRDLETRVFSEGDGRFELIGLLPGVKQLEIRADGLATLHPSAIRLSRGGSRDDLRFVMSAGSVLEGRVVSEGGGHPVPGARIAARPIASGSGDGTGPRSVLAESDAAGSFRLQGLPPEVLLVIEVTPPGGGRTVRRNARAGDPALTVPVTAPPRLDGVVVTLEDGKPVDEFRLSLSTHPDGVEGGRGQRQRFAGPDGEFSMTVKRSGRWYLVADAPGFVPKAIGPLEIPRTGRLGGLEIRLERGAVVLGKLGDRAGRPVAEARVSLQQRLKVPKSRIKDRILEERWITRAEAVSFPDGSFLLPGAGVGRFRVRVDSEGHAPTESEPFEVTGAGDFPLGEITLGLAAALRGRVFDRSGSPDAKASVLITDLARPRESQALKTGPDGVFDVAGLRPGRYLVRLSRSEGRYRFAAGGAGGGRTGAIEREITVGEGETGQVELRAR